MYLTKLMLIKTMLFLAFTVNVPDLPLVKTRYCDCWPWPTVTSLCEGVCMQVCDDNCMDIMHVHTLVNGSF